MAKTVAIVSKSHHPRSDELVSKSLEILNSHKVNIIIDEETFISMKDFFSKFRNLTIKPRNDLTSISDLIIILGGDGTLISVCRHPANDPNKKAVVLGVNLFNLGFLTEIGPDGLEDALKLYFDGNTETSNKPLLKIDIQQEEPKQFFAVNDVVINKQALARMFNLSIQVDDAEATNIRGDGVIVSTPIGSTAYSLAAGGSIVHPDVDAILITPICPHSLSLRPIIIPGNAVVKLEIKQLTTAEGIFLTVDGQEGTALNPGSRISVSKSNHLVSFLRLPSNNYFTNLSNKLRWG